MKKAFLMLLVLIILTIFPMQVFASSISLDGSFGDWSDKPQLSDTIGDETDYLDIAQAKWFPDVGASKLYLYCERVAGDKDNGKKDDNSTDDIDNENASDNDIYNDVMSNYMDQGQKYKYWIVKANFDTEFGSRTAYAYYHAPSLRVIVILVDENGQYLWSTSGKWGDDKNTAQRIEFYVPLNYLAKSAGSGYQIGLSMSSGNDVVPDSGAITISTISTFPWATAVILAIFVMAGLAYFSRKRFGFGKHSV